MNFLNMVKMVLWSFFGIRNGAGQRDDIRSANFRYLPVVAVLVAAAIVAILLTFVHVVTHGATMPTQGF